MDAIEGGHEKSCLQGIVAKCRRDTLQCLQRGTVDKSSQLAACACMARCQSGEGYHWEGRRASTLRGKRGVGRGEKGGRGNRRHEGRRGRRTATKQGVRRGGERGGGGR